MKTFLVLTVGGSCAPIVTAIKDYQPDHTVFIVSTGDRGSRITIDGEQKPCQKEDKTPEVNILRQTGLQEGQYHIKELSDPDTLHLCYEEIRHELINLGPEQQEWRKIADYTGGTKTMSAALCLAALQTGWELSVVRGSRTDLIKVRDGTEMASLVNTGDVRAHQQIKQAEDLFNQYAYSPASELLKSLIRSAPLSPGLQGSIQKMVTLCHGFDAWDRFDHVRAAQILHPYRDEFLPQWIMLKKILGEIQPSKYEPVIDLFFNAGRRAHNGRYDDAVARLYRALEMLAQTRLKQRDPALFADDIDISLLPKPLQVRYAGRKDKIKLGLQEDYDLLAGLDDPLGSFYSPQRQKLLATLQKRNNSILAHGSTPCDEGVYLEMYERVKIFITDGLKTLNVPFEGIQFPILSQGKIVQR